MNQMAIQLPTYSIARPSKIYPRWNFWFENMPSGNPETGGGGEDRNSAGQRQGCQMVYLETKTPI
jgi:hypothetical protein